MLGVAFVAGSLVFTDTLGRAFTGIMAGTVGDVVVRPAGGVWRRLDAEHPHRPGLPGRRPGPGRRRGPGRRQRHELLGTFVVGKDGKVIGGPGRPRPGPELQQRPGRPRPAEPSRYGPAASPSARARSCSTRPPQPRPATRSATRCAWSPGTAAQRDRAPGRAWRVRHGGTVRREPGHVRHGHGAAALPRRRGRLHRHLGDRRAGHVPGRAARQRWRRRCPPGFEAVTGDAAADEAASDVNQARVLHQHLPAGLRRRRAGRRAPS